MIPGNGNIYVSGNVDESIKESVEIAFTYIKAHTKKLEVSDMLINNNDFYVNALKYNVKKEGSSGGVAFVTSLISLLLNKEIDSKYGFTGEISLHGNIYKVGGIKEKLIGASNAGYKKVYIPIDNSIDLETIPEEIKEKRTIKCVSNYQEIYDDLFK
jgi:ATP-dependent Lon protease